MIVPIRYESGKVKKVMSNKIGITIYSWTLCDSLHGIRHIHVRIFSLLYFSFSNFDKIWVARFYFDTLILLISYAKIHNSKISISSMKNVKLWGILCINSTQFSAYETMSGPLQNHPCTLGTPRGILETVNQNTWMSSTKLKFSRSFWGAEQV